MATMVLGGLWHGANWTFAAWGTWHGLLLVLPPGAGPPGTGGCRPFWQRNVTFLLVTLGWVFFRAETFGHAAQWFAGLAGAARTRSRPGRGRRSRSPRSSRSASASCRLCPNSLELPLDRLGRAPPGGPRHGHARSRCVLMNYGSKFLYFQF